MCVLVLLLELLAQWSEASAVSFRGSFGPISAGILWKFQGHNSWMRYPCACIVEEGQGG